MVANWPISRSAFVKNGQNLGIQRVAEGVYQTKVIVANTIHPSRRQGAIGKAVKTMNMVDEKWTGTDNVQLYIKAYQPST